jgi:hypothetical protein
MCGDELRVVDAFAASLGRRGGEVRREVEFVDIMVTRHDETLYAEAKGRTEAVGLDVETMYGQLLRRMRDESAGACYAVVIPTKAVTAALRVPPWVRHRLAVTVYEVAETGAVSLHS